MRDLKSLFGSVSNSSIGDCLERISWREKALICQPNRRVPWGAFAMLHSFPSVFLFLGRHLGHSSICLSCLNCRKQEQEASYGLLRDSCHKGKQLSKVHMCGVWAVWSLTTMGKLTLRFTRQITHSYWRSWSGVSLESIAFWPLKLLPPGQSEAGYVPHYWLWHFCPKNRTLQSLSGSDRHPLWVYDIHTGLDFYRF